MHAADLSRALAERSDHIDDRWIVGIRKGWKQLLAQAKRSPARLDNPTTIDMPALQRSAAGSEAALRQIAEWLNRLRQDLLVNKGLWGGSYYEGPRTQTLDLRRAVENALGAADREVAEAMSRLTFWRDVLTPGSGQHQLDGGMRHREATRDLKSFRLYANGVLADQIPGTAGSGSALQAIDSIVSRRLLGALTAFAKKAGGEIDFGGFEPDQLSIGRVTVVFNDLGRGYGKPGPVYTTGKAEPVEARHLSARKRYIELLGDARAMLRRRGLDYLWYGRITVRCQRCGGINQYMPELGTLGVAGHYHPNDDSISIYANPNAGLPDLVLHELGHRYYYKFMSQSDRARFDSWFGKVAPTTPYGGKASAEDFAEVFEHYVLGENLTRDQLERFKEFLGRKGESIGEDMEPVSLSTIASGQQGNAESLPLYGKLDAMFWAVQRPLMKIERRYGEAPPNGDAIAAKIAADSAALLKELVFSAESPAVQKWLKKHAGTIRNARKMLEAYTKLTTWDALLATLKTQQTKSKFASDRLSEYRRYVLDVIRGLVSEVSETLAVGPYRVVLISGATGAPGVATWNRDIIIGLQATLREANRRLARIGMESVGGGTVYAYPTESLPTSTLRSHSALASYSIKDDAVSVAAAGENLLHSFIHELGHRAYFKLVEGRSRAAWSEFFESGKGAPDVENLIKDWEAYAQSSPKDPHYGYGRYLSYYALHLKKSGDKRSLMWLQLVTDALGIAEKLDYVGRPKKGTVPGLDQLVAKKSEAKVFLHPVTAYSGTSAEELFAETFAEYAVRGPRRVPPIVRMAFKQTVPQFRESRSSALSDQLQEAVA